MDRWPPVLAGELVWDRGNERHAIRHGVSREEIDGMYDLGEWIMELDPRSRPGQEPWPWLSFSGDPEAEASVASAIAAADAADAAGEPSYRPMTDEEEARLRTVPAVRIGPKLQALRASRSPAETALVRGVSDRITAYRVTHRLSQRALAEQLGMPQPNLARLELGLHTPTLETLARLARGLGVTFAIEIAPDGVRLRSTA